METFLIILDLCLIGAGGFYIYWHGQIDLRAGYSVFQAVFAAVFGMWFLSTGINNLFYIIFIAAFITLTIMGGASGLTPTRVVATGVFSRVIPYTHLAAVTLTPLALPNGRDVVVAVFGLSHHRFVRLTFRTDVQSLVALLRPRLPENMTIMIQKVQ